MIFRLIVTPKLAYAILDRGLSAIILPNLLWVRGLLLTAISVRIELVGWGFTRSQEIFT